MGGISHSSWGGDPSPSEENRNFQYQEGSSILMGVENRSEKTQQWKVGVDGREQTYLLENVGHQNRL